MANNTYDLVVIGAGPGGYVAAIRAAQLGMRVACVDKSEVGGTCLNIGCIPSKALLESSELYYQTGETFKRHGIKIRDIKLDLPAMMARKDKIVKILTSGVKGLFRKNKVEYFQGKGSIKSPGKVEVSSEKNSDVLDAKNILIATGSVPVSLPNLPFDGTHVITSTEALSLPKVPQKMVVIGAGAVGLELGSVWNRLGAEVHVIELMEHIIPGMDQECTGQLQKILEKQGMTFQLKASAQSAEIKKGKVHLTVTKNSEKSKITCDCVLVAVGRKSYTDGLGAQEAGIEIDKRGKILVDNQFQTNVPGIFAIGDVIPGPMLAHKAEEEGIAAVELMAGKAGHINYDAVPNVVYTYPELASVGMTGEAVKEKGMKVRIGKFPFRANGRAHSLEATDGMVKVISDEKTDRMLGLHILGARASDMIAEAAIAMEFSASAEDIARSVHAHPTLAEIVKEAALAVDNRAIHM